MKKSLAAALEQFRARRARTEHPDGSFDSAGRWYPDAPERRACCKSVRGPSRSHPYSYMIHCRTANHVAALHAVSASELRAAARAESPAHREGGDNYYKLVALSPEGRYLSLYDGSEWQIGVMRTERALQSHNGGLYCYSSPEMARSAEVRAKSELLLYPCALLRVRAEGAYCRYEMKLAFHQLTPLEFISIESPRAGRIDNWFCPECAQPLTDGGLYYAWCEACEIQRHDKIQRDGSCVREWLPMY
jgi:hypothetical protein